MYCVTVKPVLTVDIPSLDQIEPGRDNKDSEKENPGFC